MNKNSTLEKIVYKTRKRYFSHKLKNKNITILSNDCSAGTIYHYLGLKFLSPTINIFIANDFLVFCKHLREYKECKMKELPPNKYGYPIGQLIPENSFLPKVTILFIHYKTFEEAILKWRERFERVNYDNIFLVYNGSLYPQISNQTELNFFQSVSYNKRYFYSSNDAAASLLKSFGNNECEMISFNKVGQKWFDYGNIFSKIVGKRILFKYNFVNWFNEEYKK